MAHGWSLKNEYRTAHKGHAVVPVVNGAQLMVFCQDCGVLADLQAMSTKLDLKDAHKSKEQLGVKDA